ncbi:MAG: hypothetical protein ABEH38_09615, partial [Flavobacteriales bacterium]
VYFTQKEGNDLAKTSESDQKQKRSKKKRPPYYNPEVAERLREERRLEKLRGRNDAYYPKDQYYASPDHQKDPSPQKRFKDPCGKGCKNAPSSGSSNGSSDTEASNDTRERSTDGSDTNRKR